MAFPARHFVAPRTRPQVTQAAPVAAAAPVAPPVPGTAPAARGPRPGTAAAHPIRAVRDIRAARPLLPGVVLTVIGLGAAAVLGMWFTEAGSDTSLGDALTDAGRVVGLLSGYGFLVLVALMARLPPLERGIGAHRLAQWHAMGGRYVITLISCHVLLIIWGYALQQDTSILSQPILILTTQPDVLMATVGWLLLLVIAYLSARAVRRRVSYETWYNAHLYTYVAIALSFSHQFADGETFASLDTRIGWSVLYAVVGGLIFWYRLVTPLRMAARHRFTVHSVQPEAPGIVSVYITGRDFDRLRAEAGQFFRWRFLTRRLAGQSHPYSLSAMPRPDLLRITVKARGDHSGSIAALRPGIRVIAEGPYGAFTPALSHRRVLLIAGGVGITPIRAMFAALPNKLTDGITLIYRASHPRDIVFQRELDAIAADRNATVHYLTGRREELGYDPLGPERLQSLIPGLHRYEAYVCGPPGMTQTAIDSLLAAGTRRRRIHHESFDF